MPEKLPYDDLVNCMSPFLQFSDVESVMKRTKKEQTADTRKIIVELNDKESDVFNIEKILNVGTAVEYEKRLKVVLSLAAGSLELLDRVCMVICPEQKTWAKRFTTESARREITTFLTDPSKHEQIPWFVLERFRLPDKWYTMIRPRLIVDIHMKLRSAYGTKMGLALESRIGEVVKNAGYRYEKGIVSLVDDKEVDVVVPTLKIPRILIMSSYNLTTSSAQSQRAREQKAMYEEVCRYNSGRARAQEPPVQLINIIDGGGWITRPNDLRIMHQFCDYILPYKLLHKLPSILRYHMEQTARSN